MLPGKESTANEVSNRRGNSQHENSTPQNMMPNSTPSNLPSNQLPRSDSADKELIAVLNKELSSMLQTLQVSESEEVDASNDSASTLPKNQNYNWQATKTTVSTLCSPSLHSLNCT